MDHFIYSSIGSADRHAGIPNYESKATNGRYMFEVGLPLTVLRPVHFMENFKAPAMRQQVADGRLVMALDPCKELQIISVEDIGFIAAIAMDHPEDWMGRSIELAGDSLTLPQTAELFSAAANRKIEFHQRELQELKRVYNEQYLTMRWLNERGYEADIDAIKRIHPSMMDLSHWIDLGYWNREREETSSVLPSS